MVVVDGDAASAVRDRGGDLLAIADRSDDARNEPVERAGRYVWFV